MCVHEVRADLSVQFLLWKDVIISQPGGYRGTKTVIWEGGEVKAKPGGGFWREH